MKLSKSEREVSFDNTMKPDNEYIWVRAQGEFCRTADRETHPLIYLFFNLGQVCFKTAVSAFVNQGHFFKFQIEANVVFFFFNQVLLCVCVCVCVCGYLRVYLCVCNNASFQSPLNTRLHIYTIWKFYSKEYTAMSRVLNNLKQNEAQSARAESTHKGGNSRSKDVAQTQQRPIK